MGNGRPLLLPEASLALELQGSCLTRVRPVHLRKVNLVQVLNIKRLKFPSLAQLKDLRQDEKIKVLIVYDGSENSDVALDDLSRAGLPHGVEALALVTDVCLPSSPEDINRAVAERRMMVLKSGVSSFVPVLRDLEQERVMSDKAKGRLRSIFPMGEVKSEALSERHSIRRGTVRRAEAWGADLIVIGSQKSPSPQITDYCGAAVEIAAQSHCSARIARPSKAIIGSPARILIGVDGSPDAINCFRAVLQRSWPNGSEARVVLVPRPGPRIDTTLGTDGLTVDGAEPRSTVTKVFERGVGELRASGLRVSMATRNGVPVEVLIEEARESSADCIFVDALAFSRRPESPNDGPPLSNVVRALAMGAPCSVEIVRGHSLNQEYLKPAA
jgi:nucleotide-binding universal stress UspA family protein